MPARPIWSRTSRRLPDGDFAYGFRGEFSGAQLKAEGLPIDLDAGVERCAAFWIQEKTSSDPQVLYADAAVTSYSGDRLRRHTGLVSRRKCKADAQRRPRELIVFKPGENGVEDRAVTLDAQGRATAAFDATTITETAIPDGLATVDQHRGPPRHDHRRQLARQVRRSWPPGLPARRSSRPAASPSTRPPPVYVWGKDDATARVLALPAGQTGAKVAACWTTGDQFTMSVGAPAGGRTGSRCT